MEYISRSCSSINREKVIYDSSRDVKQQFVHNRMRFYQANFEQNILFGPCMSCMNYHLTAKCKTEKRKSTFFIF